MKIEVNEKAINKLAGTLDEQVKEIALEVVRDKTIEMQTKAKEFASARTKSRRGRLLAGITYKIQTKKNGLITGVVKTTASTKAPKKPGKRNINLSERTYKNGALYGTYLEASKRFKGGGSDVSKYAHLHPAYDLVKPTVKAELEKRIREKMKR